MPENTKALGSELDDQLDRTPKCGKCGEAMTRAASWESWALELGWQDSGYWFCSSGEHSFVIKDDA